MSILVFGATGRVGKQVVDVLQSKGIPCRVSSREPEKIFEKVPEGITTVYADLEKPETFPKALKGIKRVFLYNNPRNINEFIQEAEKAGVEYVVLLSTHFVVVPEGAVPNFLAQLHIKVEDALRNSTLKWTFLRPVGFSANALRDWAPSIKSHRTIKTPYPNSYSSCIHERDMAEAAVIALTTNTLVGTAPSLTGPEPLTISQRVKIISDAIKQPINIEVQTLEQAQAQYVHVPAPVVASLLGAMKETDGKPTQVTDDVEKITGHNPRSFAQWVQENISAFL